MATQGSICLTVECIDLAPKDETVEVRILPFLFVQVSFSRTSFIPIHRIVRLGSSVDTESPRLNAPSQSCRIPPNPQSSEQGHAKLPHLTWTHITIALQTRASKSSALPLTRLLDVLANLCGRLPHPIARQFSVIDAWHLDVEDPRAKRRGWMSIRSSSGPLIRS